ncbi:MAG: lysylphosphatidylglycerol synthase transmembrane domain-containing protein [Bacteroidales bacterium]|jgi:uncharacterized protein (TIRG00374 family)
MKITLKDILKFLFFLGIGFLLIWLFVRKLTSEEIDSIFASLKNIKYSWLILAFIFGVISVIARASRWIILIEPLGYKPKYSNMFFSVLVAYIANLAFPRLGEVARCGVLTKYEEIPFEKSFGTVITERICDLLVFFILLIANIIIQYSVLEAYVNEKILGRLFGKNAEIPILLIIFISFVALVLILVFIVKKFPNNKFAKKTKKVFSGFIEGIKSFSKIQRPWAFLFHTVLLWVCYFYMTRVVFYCLAETSFLGSDAAFSSLVFSTIGNILVQGGIGIYPMIVSEILTVYGCTSAIGYTMGWLIWINQTMLIIIGGIVAFIVLPFINNNNKDNKPKEILPDETNIIDK